MLRRALPIASLLAALALAPGCAGAKSTASSIPESASLAPADALAYVTVTTDEGSEQWKNAAGLLERIPGAKDGVSGSISSALGEQGVDWSSDVRPAIGPELVVVATADQDPIARDHVSTHRGVGHHAGMTTEGRVVANGGIVGDKGMSAETDEG
jgi:hypothetical protein